MDVTPAALRKTLVTQVGIDWQSYCNIHPQRDSGHTITTIMTNNTIDLKLHVY